MATVAAQAHRPLIGALVRSSQAAGLVVSVDDGSFRRWASNTYEGGRHQVQLHGASSPALLDWLGGLDEDTVRIPGFTIASCEASTIEFRDGRTTAWIEAITLKDG